MTDKDQHAIIIVKRQPSLDGGHHGGAWKIAFADFMTAMMALFLVLWLISSTSDKTKHAVAQYFNPVKLVDATTLKKGFRDPKDTEMAAGPRSREAKPDSDTNKSLAETREVVLQPGAKKPTRSESTLFRDPYAVLGDIAADPRTGVAEDEPPKPVSGPAEITAADATPETIATFSDPFTTIPHEDESTGSAEPPAPRQTATEAVNQKAAAAPAPRPTSPPSPDGGGQGGSASAASGRAATPPQVNDPDASQLASEVAALAKLEARTGSGPHVDVQSAGEGILISLTDDRNFSMFAVGSAEPQPKTVEVMALIGQLLKTRPGAVIVRGHTDGRPFKSATYDNWRLSAARAHMAHYMLVRGGLDEKRIERIEAYADRRLRIPEDPMAAANRRIEILLRKEKP